VPQGGEALASLLLQPLLLLVVHVSLQALAGLLTGIRVSPCSYLLLQPLLLRTRLPTLLLKPRVLLLLLFAAATCPP
jgi:hypothetical protein